MQQIRMVGWLERSGAVAVRRANLCDAAGLSAGITCPVTIGFALHYLSIDIDDYVPEPGSGERPEDILKSMQETCANGATTSMFWGLLLSIVALLAHILERCAYPYSSTL